MYDQRMREDTTGPSDAGIVGEIKDWTHQNIDWIKRAIFDVKRASPEEFNTMKTREAVLETLNYLNSKVLDVVELIMKSSNPYS